MSGLVGDHMDPLLVEVTLGRTLIVLDSDDEKRVHRALVDLVIILLEITDVGIYRRLLLDLLTRLVTLAAIFDDGNASARWWRRRCRDIEASICSGEVSS